MSGVINYKKLLVTDD